MRVIENEREESIERIFYREDYMAGSELEMKYHQYLSWLVQNNKLITKKANDSGAQLGSLFFDIMRIQEESRELQKCMDEMPNVLNTLDSIKNRVSDICLKIENTEKMINQQVTLTAQSRLRVLKEETDNEVKFQTENYNQILLAAELKYSRIAENTGFEKKK
eukprot:TRINITY_DN10320_c0_g1_i1.p1 TRINITY_DN10320_c0_g1~~TRINITY_DN10320_c0_g1_i1.p1  ORF type:complete len:163 (+),score=58.19 TRINITY_DN10320_c0_g1_i1:329-817(+)